MVVSLVVLSKRKYSSVTSTAPVKLLEGYTIFVTNNIDLKEILVIFCRMNENKNIYLIIFL